MKYCHTKDDVPKVKHYAILTFGSYTVPGDERSRTNPGHGYPEHIEHTASYVAYNHRAEWEAEIQRLTTRNMTSYSKDDFVALLVDPASVTTQVNVKVQE